MEKKHLNWILIITIHYIFYTLNSSEKHLVDLENFQSQSPLYAAVKRGHIKKVNNWYDSYKYYKSEYPDDHQSEILLKRAILTGNPNVINLLFDINVLHPKNISKDIITFASQRTKVNKVNQIIFDNLSLRKRNLKDKNNSGQQE